ncbi:lysozyme inhibitor LprI family protein, partial [Burkholderia cenocepacia]
QTSMNFCAWRDQIVAERELQQVVDKQVAEHPERKIGLEAKVAKWKKARDTSCEKSARKEWGDGSMRPAAQAICATAATKRMTKRLSVRVTGKPS